MIAARSLSMPLAPGTRLGAYVVNTLIGVGRGEVYRAFDTRAQGAYWTPRRGRVTTRAPVNVLLNWMPADVG